MAYDCRDTECDVLSTNVSAKVSGEVSIAGGDCGFEQPFAVCHAHSHD